VGEIRELGGELIIVGNGSAHMAKAFVEDVGLDAPLYTDPSRKTYDAAGLHRGVGRTLGASSIMSGVRALKKGHIQGLTKGDAWQQGGVFVFGPGDAEYFAYASKEAGDHPDPSALLDALRSAAAS